MWAGLVLAAASKVGFPQAGRRAPAPAQTAAVRLAVREPVVKTVWIVRWRGLEETCTCLREALDRPDQLDARGIATELCKVAGGQWQKIC